MKKILCLSFILNIYNEDFNKRILSIFTVFLCIMDFNCLLHFVKPLTVYSIVLLGLFLRILPLVPHIPTLTFSVLVRQEQARDYTKSFCRHTRNPRVGSHCCLAHVWIQALHFQAYQQLPLAPLFNHLHPTPFISLSFLFLDFLFSLFHPTK